MNQPAQTTKPTLGDIAQAAGVSIATVSRVLNRSTRVSDELTERVTRAIKQLNYRPNALARSLRVDRTFTIGLLCPDVTNVFFAELARDAEQYFRERGYMTVLCNTHEDSKTEREYLQRLIEHQVDGLLMIPACEDSPHIKQLVDREIPIVLVDRMIGLKVDTVRVDNFDGTLHAISHLVSRGYRRIAIIAGPQNTLPGQERFEAYKQAVNLHNLAFDPRLVRIGDFSIQSGYTLAHELLAEAAPPDSLFVSNNLMGIGAFKAIKERGLAMPKDFGLVQFDDVHLADVSDPPITVVAQPVEEIARTAAELLLRRIEGKGSYEPQQIVLRPRLIVRQSA